MKVSSLWLSVLMLIFLTFGCAHNSRNKNLTIHNKKTTSPAVPVATKDNNDFYALNLSGNNEIPASVATPGSGKLYLKANSDKTRMYFTVYVDSLKNISKVTINYGTKDYNGPPIVRLYPAFHTVADSLIGRTFSGLLASGAITKAFLTEHALKGEKISGLIRAIRNDSAYIQIHTKYHRDGAIRAQIQSNH